MNDHINDVDNILSRLEEVDLTLSTEKSKFGTNEILVVGMERNLTLRKWMLLGR